MTTDYAVENGIGKLFEPFQIKDLVLPNRFIMPAMQRGWCADGAPLQQLTNYYRRRVEGGVSLVISESCAIAHPTATKQPLACSMTSKTASSWRACIGEIHDAGGLFFVQLWHEGAFRNDEDGQTVSASGLAYPGLESGQAATAEQLQEIIDGYAESAWLAQLAGANGVEIHCAHGYFLDQFLWAKTNLRNDDFGGNDLVARAQLHLRILKAIRLACGESFVISLRFSQWKEHDFTATIANTPEELGLFLKLMSEAGADIFHASTRRFWEPAWEGSERTLAGWTRALSGKPTVAVGSVGLDRDVMASFTDEGEAVGTVPETVRQLKDAVATDQFDLLAIGRSLIGDPDWVRKLQHGETGKIRPFQKRDIADVEWDS
ncbi:12-oxophytodienoate reductase [Sphingobium sp. H33]|uniref:12-oxophytodienoate reductase n=2 Tax=Sphingobium nicotianae TaxID=2782607 RepID=A0A9X1D9Y9_9SPHN|nr:12-oxophytodienoate reductase [Sphingobium nicotianae]MBT2186065.1 12-oxophytodienoate reductase [Sphingobium nicotianae]